MLQRDLHIQCRRPAGVASLGGMGMEGADELASPLGSLADVQVVARPTADSLLWEGFKLSDAYLLGC
jgi:hypothetical protein